MLGHCKALGLEPGSEHTFEQIKTQANILRKTWHPDKSGQDTKEQFAKIQVAFEYISAFFKRENVTSLTVPGTNTQHRQMPAASSSGSSRSQWGAGWTFKPPLQKRTLPTDIKEAIAALLLNYIRNPSPQCTHTVVVNSKFYRKGGIKTISYDILKPCIHCDSTGGNTKFVSSLDKTCMSACGKCNGWGVYQDASFDHQHCSYCQGYGLSLNQEVLCPHCTGTRHVKHTVSFDMTLRESHDLSQPILFPDRGHYYLVAGTKTVKAGVLSVSIYVDDEVDKHLEKEEHRQASSRKRKVPESGSDSSTTETKRRKQDAITDEITIQLVDFLFGFELEYKERSHKTSAYLKWSPTGKLSGRLCRFDRVVMKFSSVTFQGESDPVVIYLDVTIMCPNLASLRNPFDSKNISSATTQADVLQMLLAKCCAGMPVLNLDNPAFGELLGEGEAAASP